MKMAREDVNKFIEDGYCLTTRMICLGGGDDEGEITFTSAQKVIKALHLLACAGPKKPITILLNSDGGAWLHGMAIWNVIEAIENHVTVIVLGEACSMATVLLQAADYRIVAPDGLFMIHAGETAYSGSPKSVENWILHEQKTIQNRMYEIYLERFKDADRAALSQILNPKLPGGCPKVYPRKSVNRTQIEQLCSQDVIFTAKEMVATNLADRMLERGDILGAHVNPYMHGLPSGLESLYDEEKKT
jgi:ATP-dependent protease ClpP protease subunit